MEIKNVAELDERLGLDKIVIYGAGYVAIRFYQALVERGTSQNVSCFVITSGEHDAIQGIPVITFGELPRDEQMTVCIAVHEAVKDEIIANLREKGFERYVWVCPFLYELMLGTPIHRGVEVSLKEIFSVCKKDYRMAVRYLALDQYFGKNTNGYEIYIQTGMLYTDRKTTENRLQKFIELIRNWEENGYDVKQCSLLLENYEIIDGMHRIAVASYFDQETIMCDVYPKTKNMSQIHSQEAVTSRDALLKAGIDTEIIELLEQTNKRIEEKYR